MTHCVKLILAAALVAAVFVTKAHAETKVGEIRRTILQLGDEDPKKRDAAQELLAEIGPEAVLLYRPDDQGKDPEIRRRMRELLAEWNFGEADDAASLRYPRVAPWVDIAPAMRTGNWPSLEDDRIAEVLPALIAKENGGIVFLSRSDVVLTPALMKASLPALEQSGAYMLAVRPEFDLPEESRRILLEHFHATPNEEDPSEAIVLWRLGEKERLLQFLKAGKAPRWDDETYDVLESDPEFCDAAGAAFASESWACADRFRTEKFARYYRESENADALAALRPEVAKPLLKELLNSAKSSVRLRAALALGAWGEQPDELKEWDSCETWRDSVTERNYDSMKGELLPRVFHWPTDVLARAAFSLPKTATSGESVENRLRKMFLDPALDRSWWPSVSVLRGLAARNRSRDITFIYEKMQVLPPSFQCEIAVDLARMGSSAGAGLLIPRLYQCGWAQRRDANEALKKITGQDFGYNPAGTLPERCRAARKWSEWWKANKTTFQPDVK